MAKDKDKDVKLTSTEKEILDEFQKEGYCQVDDVSVLEKLAPKLEKIYGTIDPKLSS